MYSSLSFILWEAFQSFAPTETQRKCLICWVFEQSNADARAVEHSEKLEEYLWGAIGLQRVVLKRTNCRWNTKVYVR